MSEKKSARQKRPLDLTVGRRIELDKPWQCECGQNHEIGLYVAAHWDELLTHTCNCGRKHTLQSGLLTLILSPNAQIQRPSCRTGDDRDE